MKKKATKVVPIPKLKAKAQELCNKYIRLRDAGKPCISCGSDKANQAGHFIAVNQSSFLRFEESNIHLQCSYCNCHLHGNQIAYRLNLIKKIGEAEVNRLEADYMANKVYKWTREELEQIIEHYKEKISTHET